MSPVAWISPAIIALCLAVFGGGILLTGARETAIVLAFLALGSAGTRGALASALALGIALESIGHLPWSAITVPGVALVGVLTILHPWLQRRAWPLRTAIATAAALIFTAGLPNWLLHLGLPTADVQWIPALLASGLWLPLVMLATPPDTAI